MGGTPLEAMPVPRSNRSSEDILLAEFDYIAGTAGQANEDRSRVDCFLVIEFGFLFFTLTLLGTTTVVQLARLRAAWFESALAMNRIKEYAIQKEKKLAQAFRWRGDSLPALYKVNSISFLQTLEVALLSGLTFGAAAYFFQIGIDYTRCLWAFTISLGLLALVGQLFIYKRLLSEDGRNRQSPRSGPRP
jgi:hypothetical protein